MSSFVLHLSVKMTLKTAKLWSCSLQNTWISGAESKTLEWNAKHKQGAQPRAQSARRKKSWSRSALVYRVSLTAPLICLFCRLWSWVIWQWWRIATSQIVSQILNKWGPKTREKMYSHVTSCFARYYVLDTPLKCSLAQSTMYLKMWFKLKLKKITGQWQTECANVLDDWIPRTIIISIQCIKQSVRLPCILMYLLLRYQCPCNNNRTTSDITEFQFNLTTYFKFTSNLNEFNIKIRSPNNIKRNECRYFKGAVSHIHFENRERHLSVKYQSILSVDMLTECQLIHVSLYANMLTEIRPSVSRHVIQVGRPSVANIGWHLFDMLVDTSPVTCMLQSTVNCIIIGLSVVYWLTVSGIVHCWPLFYWNDSNLLAPSL